MLVADPQAHIAESFVEALQHSRRAATRAARLRDGGDAHADRAVAEAGNQAFFEAVAGALEPFVDARAVAELAIAGRSAAPQVYSDAVPYALRDWGHSDASEAELRAIDTRVRALLPPGPGGTALVLGAGTGRTAWDLRDHFDEVVAIDRTFAMAYAFTRIHAGGLTLHESHLCTDGPSRFAARLLTPGPQPVRRGAFELWVANASELPVADASVDAVCCFYFLDVLRLSTLVAEIRRVLRPGGYLLNLGPLIYHHDEILEHLDPERIRGLLQSFDLVIDRGSEEWTASSHLKLSSSMVKMISHHTWSFRADLSPRRVTRATVLRARYPISVHIERARGDETVTLSSAGKLLEVEMLQADAVTLLDGQRTVQSCIDVLCETYELDDAAQASIVEEFERLRTIGFLEWVLDPPDRI